MKKKLLLTAIMAMVIALALALSISAESRTSISYTDINGITHDVPVVKYDDATAETVAAKLSNNATVQARFVDNGAYSIVKATDGTLTAYPTWYFIEPSGNDASYVAISEIEYTYVNAMSGKTYNKGAMVYVEFPSGMTHARNNSVFGKKNNGNPYETNITDFYFPSTLVAFESESFKSMPSLKRVYIEAGNQVKSIPSSTFSNSTVEYIQFENLTELETLDGVTNTKLTGDIDLSKTKLKTIKAGAFSQCMNMGKITLPDTLETIENGAFENTGNAYLASPYLPKNLKSVGQRFFAYNNNLLDTYIFPEGVTSIGAEPFQDSKVSGDPAGKKLNLVFLGEVTGVVYLNGNGHQKHAEEVTVYFANNTKDQYNKNGFYVKPSSISYTDVERAIRVVFCKGDNVADLIYLTNTNGSSWQEGTFEMDGHTHFTSRPLDCKGDACIVCDIIQRVEHQKGELLSIEYPNGYASKGYKSYLCRICEKDFLTDESFDAIFVASETNGFSTNGTDGIAFGGYLINTSALEAYNNSLGENSLKFGIMLVNPNYLNGTHFMKNGLVEAPKGVLQVDLSTTEYVSVSVMINGFVGDAANIELVIALYAYTDASDVDFIQSEHTACASDTVEKEDATLYTVSFGSVKKATMPADIGDYDAPKKQDA